jgi:hypothetical protein
LLYLDQVGKFEGVRGIVVGELAGCEWDEYTSAPRSKTLEEVLEDRLGGLGVPVLYAASMATIRLGVEATLDADALTLRIEHNSSDTTHGATAIGTSPSLTTNAFGVRRQRRGPFISVRVLSRAKAGLRGGELMRCEHAQHARAARKRTVAWHQGARRLCARARSPRSGEPTG